MPLIEHSNRDTIPVLACHKIFSSVQVVATAKGKHWTRVTRTRQGGHEATKPRSKRRSDERSAIRVNCFSSVQDKAIRKISARIEKHTEQVASQRLCWPPMSIKLSLCMAQQIIYLHI